MTFKKKNEEAVSPVIGVILMVAVTVILAAVIAAFVFGMAGNLQKNKVVAATASHQNSKIYVVYQGGPDSTLVSSLRTMVNGVALSVATTAGSENSVAETTADKNNHVVVTATFSDGSTQVILDTFV